MIKHISLLFTASNRLLQTNNYLCSKRACFSKWNKYRNCAPFLKTILPPGMQMVKNAKLHIYCPTFRSRKSWCDVQLVASDVAISDNVMLVKVNMKGFKHENISVKVEGNWLLIEAHSSVVNNGNSPSFSQRHVMRRYEIPSNAALNGIKSSLDKGKDVLLVTVPRNKPSDNQPSKSEKPSQ
ncbi:uncharacterized protein LOC106669344 [Cimex lectularius]|uniref:SHSP domain-containing protein n=1 Tax=Cimex lectularius TaxID=79782 RepID=A0A8I6S1K3_CIMLE|nr:uncharacterized protein LOC106669344 [Cimex lectularius]